MRLRWAWPALFAAISACSSSASAPASGSDASATGAAAASAAPVPVPSPLPLGKASLDDFAYRRGAGRDDYDRAVKAEKLARDDSDWQKVADACRAALAKDAGHLDAAWLYAAALARLGQDDQILAPLSQAVAGDWAKWGERSLTLPLFDHFLASRWGAAWKELAEQYRAAFAESARRAIVVLGRDASHGTEVYGWDPQGGRWLRLTRTGGTVVAALPQGGLVAYVAYRDLAGTGDHKSALRRPRVAVIDLDTGRVSREQAFADVDQLRLGWHAGKAGDDPTLVAEIEGGADAGMWTIDWKRERKKAAAKDAILRDAIVVERGKVRRLRLPLPAITADWDDNGLASAIRLDATKRTITPPAGYVVSGHDLAWSPDRARLALVATPDGDCTAPSKLFVVDAGTGRLHEVGPATSPAPTWLDATHLAYTVLDMVVIFDVIAEKAEHTLTSVGGVATAFVDRACASGASDEAVFAVRADDQDDDSEDTADEEAPTGDAGVALPDAGK